MSTTIATTTGWTEPRVRRARMFAVLLVACAIVACWALFQPWFAWATPGLAPSCDPAPTGAPTISIQNSNRDVIDGIAARGCVTGAETVATYDSPVGSAAGAATVQQSLESAGTTKAPAEMLGLPRAATALLGCLALGWFGVVTRRGYMLVVAMFFLQLPHRDLTAIRTSFLADSMSSLTLALPGLQVFTWALLGATVFLGVSMIFVLKVNYQQRAEARRVAREAGEADPHEALDPLLSFAGRQIGKIKSAADESSTRAAVRSSQS